jgi:hypothetical protein
LDDLKKHLVAKLYFFFIKTSTKVKAKYTSHIWRHSLLKPHVVIIQTGKNPILKFLNTRCEIRNSVFRDELWMQVRAIWNVGKYWKWASPELGKAVGILFQPNSSQKQKSEKMKWESIPVNEVDAEYLHSSWGSCSILGKDWGQGIRIKIIC